jgi:hypothetical protein
LILTICLVALVAAPLHADDAPMQMTTAGLVPGMPGTTVRMAAEKVDINVVERDGGVHAMVNASFDMFNRGPAVTMWTGFPRFSGSGAEYFGVPGGFAGFDASNFADFHASSGDTVFQPAVQMLASPSTTQANEKTQWYVWQMGYPANATTTVKVSYDQTLSPEVDGWTDVSYILLTGALWDGTIGDATVTMSSSGSGGGGTFVVPTTDELKQAFGPQAATVARPESAQPTSKTDAQVVWHLTDFKPTFDPFAYYIPAGASQRLTSAQARLALNAPSSSDYAAAVQAYLDTVGRDSSGLPWLIRHRPPQALSNRFAEVAGWADTATQLDPTSAAAFESLGDIEYARELHGATMFIGCRPQLAPRAYQTAVSLGSPTAQAKLDEISQLVLEPSGRAHSCTIDPNQPVADSIPDTLTDTVQTEIVDAIQRANRAWSDTQFNLTPDELTDQVAGQALSDDMAEIAQLRQAHQRRRTTSVDFAVLDASIDVPGHAVVHTRETWSAEILDMANLQVLQQVPPTAYTQVYELQYIDGGWTVTRNDLQ